MGKEELIKKLNDLINNNFINNLNDSERDLLIDKLKSVEENTFSLNAVEKLNSLLNQIENNLKAGSKTYQKFENLITKLLNVTTESERNKIIDNIISFNSICTYNNLIEIAQKIGEFDLNNYFESTNNQYSIYLIDYDKKDIIFQDGFESDELKEKCIESINFECNNISALYGQQVLNETIEVFMLNKDLVESQDSEMIELIIFHEICHLIEKTKYYKSLEIEFTDDEIKMGNKLSSIANNVDEMTGGWGNDIDHNNIFGSILFRFLKRFNFQNRYSLLAKSMIKNFLDDYTEEFIATDNK